MASSMGSRERRSNLVGLERREERTAPRELDGIPLAHPFAEKVHVAPDIDLGCAHEEGGQLPGVLPERPLGKLPPHAVHGAVALDPEEVIASRSGKLLQELADGPWPEVGAPREHARDDAILRRIDDQTPPRVHVARAQRERSEDRDVEGHPKSLPTTAPARRGGNHRCQRTVGPAPTVWEVSFESLLRGDHRPRVRHEALRDRRALLPRTRAGSLPAVTRSGRRRRRTSF